MKRLLLVNPWIHDFAAHDFWLKPVGLLALAASLKAAGFKISFLDLTDNLPFPELASAPLRRKPDGSGRLLAQEIQKPAPLKKIPRRYKRYGIPPAFAQELLAKRDRPAAVLLGTTMTYWYPGYVETAQMLKKIFPAVPLIAGGLYVTLLPEHARKNLPADFFCLGDYERALPAILQNILGAAPALTSPEQTRLPLELYPRLHYGVVMTGRGCPFRCPYCVSWKLHPHLQRKTPEAVVDEISWQARSLGVRNIAFYDDALLLEPEKHIMPILEGVIRAGISLNFHTPNGLHLKPMTAELARLMKRAGFSVMRFGLETADPGRQKMLGPKAGLDDLSAALEYLENAGYDRKAIGVYMLAGLPGQSTEEIERDLRAVKKLGGRPYLSEYSPIPGTDLWEAAVPAARFDFVSEPLFQNCSVLACAHPSLTPQRLSRLRALCKE